MVVRVQDLHVWGRGPSWSPCSSVLHLPEQLCSFSHTQEINKHIFEKYSRGPGDLSVQAGWAAAVLVGTLTGRAISRFCFLFWLIGI